MKIVCLFDVYIGKSYRAHYKNYAKIKTVYV